MAEKDIFLIRAQNAFSEWRSTRKKRGLIPDELILLACHASEHSGVSFVAKKLNLNSNRLLRQVEQFRSKSSECISAPILTREGFHFSRLELNKEDAFSRKKTVTQEMSTHAQIHLQNGNTVSLNTLSSVRLMFRELMFSGRGSKCLDHRR
jgi:hypothetical protein